MRRALSAVLASVSLVLPVFAQAQSKPAAKPSEKAPASAPALDEGKYFPVSQLRVGQKGYGVSIFQGDTPERFDVEILGVIDGMPNPKQKFVIARLSGANVERTRVFAGMSGSPVYIDGKLAGAIAYSFPFETEPIAGITPIEQMAGQLKTDTPAPRVSGGKLSFADMVASRGASTAFAPAAALTALPSRLTVPVGAAVASSPALAQYAGQQMQPIATPLAFSGIPQSVIDQFAPEFQRLGIMPVAGGVGGDGSLAPMVPATKDTLTGGSSVTVSLIRGDYQAAASGTVTERDGDRILAFGHPFLSLGPTDMPMAESSVVVVVPNANNSFKLCTTKNLVGSIGQDRSTGIGGTIGRAARMIPVHVAFKSSKGDTQDYRFEIIDDPTLAPLLANMAILSTIMGTERQMGDQTVQVKGRIQLEGQPEMTLENRFSSSSNAAAAAAMSVVTPLNIVLNSGFKDVVVKGIDVEVGASDERSVGSLTKVWVDKTRVGRGETVMVQAFARTEDGQQFVERIPVQIPRDTPIGKVGILVGDGSTLVASDETLASFVPETLGQLVSAINKLKKNDRLYVKVVRATGGALVDNQPLTALPPSVLASLGSPRASGGVTPLQTSTLSDQEIAPASFVIAGQQSIVLDVVR